MRNRLAGIALLTALGGCSITYENKYAYNEGWRQAQVVEIAPASQIKSPQFFDCRASATALQLATRPFVVLSYTRHGRWQNKVELLPDGADLRPGDEVYMDSIRCMGAIVKRQS